MPILTSLKLNQKSGTLLRLTEGTYFKDLPIDLN